MLMAGRMGNGIEKKGTTEAEIHPTNTTHRIDAIAMHRNSDVSTTSIDQPRRQDASELAHHLLVLVCDALGKVITEILDFGLLDFVCLNEDHRHGQGSTLPDEIFRVLGEGLQQSKGLLSEQNPHHTKAPRSTAKQQSTSAQKRGLMVSHWVLATDEGIVSVC